MSCRAPAVLGHELRNPLAAISTSAQGLEHDGSKTKGHILDVQDNGIGIDIALQTRIFELFHQIKVTEGRQDTDTGLGIGLALVQQKERALN